MRALPYALRAAAILAALAGLAATRTGGPSIELLVAALVFAQLGGAFPTVRPQAGRELERLIDDGRAAVGRLNAHLSLFETSERATTRRPADPDRTVTP